MIDSPSYFYCKTIIAASCRNDKCARIIPFLIILLLVVFIVKIVTTTPLKLWLAGWVGSVLPDPGQMT